MDQHELRSKVITFLVCHFPGFVTDENFVEGIVFLCSRMYERGKEDGKRLVEPSKN